MSKSTEYLKNNNIEDLDIFDSKNGFIKLSDLLDDYTGQETKDKLFCIHGLIFMPFLLTIGFLVGYYIDKL